MSTQMNDIVPAKALDLFVIISTHTLKQYSAEALGADMVTLSPVFETPNKGRALGLKDLENLLKCEYSRYRFRRHRLGGTDRFLQRIWRKWFCLYTLFWKLKV